MVRWLGLLLVSDRRLADVGRLAAIAIAAATAGPLTVQLREKDLAAGELLAMARSLRDDLASGAAAHPIRLVVNGRFDVALAAGVDGVHLPGNGPPVRRVREAAGDRLGVGVSTHSVEEARGAATDGADYVVFGPIFETPSKRGMGSPQGLSRLSDAVEAAGDVPVIAVGGIDGTRAGRCVAAGARGVAVIRAILAAADPTAAARRMNQDLTRALEDVT